MSIVINNPKVYKALDFVNKHVSSDAQRLIMGVSAITTQPIIDYYNRDVDKETRWTSVMRTIAKIVIGTTVGVIVRHSAIKLARSCPKLWAEASKTLPAYPKEGKIFWKTIDFSKQEHREINSYANTVGTIIGTATGLVTNFIVDAPLTKLTTNYLNDNVKPICMKEFSNKEEDSHGKLA